MCRTLRLWGHSPRLHGRCIGLLHDHRLKGSQLRRNFSSRAGLLDWLISLRWNQTTRCSFLNAIHIQRDRGHNSAAWHISNHRNSGDARFFHRKWVAMVGGARTQGMFSNTGLGLLDVGFASDLLRRLDRGLSCGGQWGGQGLVLGGQRGDLSRHCSCGAVGPDWRWARLFRFWKNKEMTVN